MAKLAFIPSMLQGVWKFLCDCEFTWFSEFTPNWWGRLTTAAGNFFVRKLGRVWVMRLTRMQLIFANQSEAFLERIKLFIWSWRRQLGVSAWHSIIPSASKWEIFLTFFEMEWIFWPISKRIFLTVQPTFISTVRVTLSFTKGWIRLCYVNFIHIFNFSHLSSTARGERTI